MCYNIVGNLDERIDNHDNVPHNRYRTEQNRTEQNRTRVLSICHAVTSNITEYYTRIL